jgi:hypothetical protein
VEQGAGTPLHPQRARQFSGLGEAAIDAIHHDANDAVDRLHCFRLTSASAFVGESDVRDRALMDVAKLEQFARGMEGKSGLG